jgi:hypothetical protein
MVGLEQTVVLLIGKNEFGNLPQDQSDYYMMTC